MKIDAIKEELNSPILRSSADRDVEHLVTDNLFLNLPAELACHVFSFLPCLKDVLALQLICKQFIPHSSDSHILESLTVSQCPMLRATLPNPHERFPFDKKKQLIKAILSLDPEQSCHKVEDVYEASMSMETNSPKKRWNSYLPIPQGFSPSTDQIKNMTFAIQPQTLATFELKVNPAGKTTIMKAALLFSNIQKQYPYKLDVISQKAIKKFEYINNTAYIISKNEMIRIEVDNETHTERSRKIVRTGNIRLLHHDMLYNGKLYKHEPSKDTLFVYDLTADNSDPSALWNYGDAVLEYAGENLKLTACSLRACKIYDNAIFFVHPNPNPLIKVLHLIYLDTKNQSKPKIIYTFDKATYQGGIEIAYGLLFLSTKTTIDVIDLDTQKLIRSIKMPHDLACPRQVYKTANEHNVFCSQISDQPYVKLIGDSLFYFASTTKTEPDELFHITLKHSD